MFTNYLIHDTIFGEKKRYRTQNMCFDFLYNFWLKHFSFWEKFSEILSWTYPGFPVKCPLLVSGSNETWIFSKYFTKILNDENTSSGGRAVPWGGWTTTNDVANKSDVWLTVHRNSVWIRNLLDVTLCYPLFLLYKLLNTCRATMCPSSGADDCVVLSPRVGIVPWLM